MRMIIPFLAFCLVATCNAELRTWTAVNGKEVEAEFVSNEKGIVKLKLKSGKVFEVPANKLSKEDNEIISFLAKPEGVNADEELEFREDIASLKGSDTPYRDTAYLKGSDTPYTGKAYKLHRNGKKKLQRNFKDGKVNGLDMWWHANGQKESKANFKDGNKYGLWTTWYENGQKSQETNFKDGKMDGLWAEWYRDGQKKFEKNYTGDDEPDGLHVFWHKNGQKKYEGNWKDGRREGSEKFWNSKGEPVATWDEAKK